jgi:DNA-binding protein HU-beta
MPPRLLVVPADPVVSLDAEGIVKKAGLVAEVALRADVTRKTAENCIEATFDAIAAAMANGEECKIAGFGTFSSREYDARHGRNPRTGERIEIEARRYPAFRAARSLKDDMIEYGLGGDDDEP